MSSPSITHFGIVEKTDMNIASLITIINKSPEYLCGDLY